MRKLFILVCLIFGAVSSSAQNFQRIYLFEDTFAFVNDIFVTDSCYYFTGTTGIGATRADVVFGTIGLDGTLTNYVIDETPLNFDLSYGARTQLDTNFRGNFIVGYSSRTNNWTRSQVQLTEFAPSGTKILDKLYDFYTTDSLNFFDSGEIITSNSDSTYYLAFTYADYTQDESDPHYSETGVMLAKADASGDTIWTKHFHHPSIAEFKPQWAIRNLQFIDDQTLLLTIMELSIAADPFNDQARIRFFKLNRDGDILNQHLFTDGTYAFSGFGVLPLSDGGLIHCYYDDTIVPISSGGQEKNYRPNLSRLNGNFQQVWKKKTQENFTHGFGMHTTPYRMLMVNDTVFAGAFTWYKDTMYNPEIWNSHRAIAPVRVFQKHINGADIWNRDYVYWSVLDSINEPEYYLRDFERTPDGGFIACGSVKHFDSLVAGNLGQFGYVLKVNCLGFMGDPECAYSYATLDSMKVAFTNQSIQAGSYLWQFGDGDSVTTNENEVNVSHTYAEPGQYEVILISYGCNGVNDTLVQTIVVPEIPSDTVVYVGDGTLLTLFPNPVMEGNSLSVYIGAVDSTSTHFELIDYQGKVVFSRSIQQGNTLYILPIQLAAGTYIVALRKEKEVIETERLIVH